MIDIHPIEASDHSHWVRVCWEDGHKTLHGPFLDAHKASEMADRLKKHWHDPDPPAWMEDLLAEI